MQLSHDPIRTHASFDDPHLVSRAGLVPVMSLAERAGLQGLARRRVTIGAAAGGNAGLKGRCPRAGMAAGAGRLPGIGPLRPGGAAQAARGARAPTAPRAVRAPLAW